MKTNHVKAALARGEITFGAWLSIPSPFTARQIARLPFDWLMIDTEHSPIDQTLMALMVAAVADANGPAPFVRVPFNSVENIKRALDSGAWGVLVPMVNTVEEARAVVEACKYPPEGSRSIGGAYAPLGFGLTDRKAYFEAANREILVAIQLESKQALENCDEILAVPGLDLALIGPNDLHASLGLAPRSESDEPAFNDALDRIKRVAARHAVPLGMFASGGDAARQRAQEGYKFISVTTDMAALEQGLNINFQNSRL